MKDESGITPGARVAVAMSGGVDSSVTAALLKEAGYDVIGVTMTLWSCHQAKTSVKQTCCSTADVADARAVCDRLGIPHVIADYRTEFRQQVIDAFAAEYQRARTPIPCIGCNQHFKFDRLWTTMHEEHGAQYLATGHYARIQRDADGRALGMWRGRDPRKDQSYYLFVITASQLAHSLFPIGDLTKPEVRNIAQRLGLQTAEKPESFEICFVPDNDYAGFIEDHYPERAGAPGALRDQEGQVVGQHRGTHAYTIGQRRGLGLGGGPRRYVTAIDPATREVTVGQREALLSNALFANQVNWIRPLGSPATPLTVHAKIRANHEPAACVVTAQGDARVQVTFNEPQTAITPGQAVVWYDGDEVVGGGWIE